jgi:phage terminase small subunit
VQGKVFNTSVLMNYLSGLMSFPFTIPQPAIRISLMLPNQPQIDDDIEPFDLNGSIEALPLNKQIFMRQFLVDLNASAAARRCGYSATSCRVTACTMFQDPALRKIRAEYTKMVLEQHDVSVSRTLDELHKLAFTNIDDIVTWTGNNITISNLEDIPPEMRAAVKRVSRVTTPQGTRLEVEMHDKLKALEMIGKYHAMFTDKMKVDANVNSSGVLRVPEAMSAEEWESQQ